MQTTTQHDNKRRGSALLLVVVVTVLLAVVGVMFVMVARVGEMETSAVIDSRDLDTAVESVVTRIHTVLVEDLFGTNEQMLTGGNVSAARGPDERRDFAVQSSPPIGPGPNGQIDPAIAANNDDVWNPGTLDDSWLASLEPVLRPGPDDIFGTGDDFYEWPRITDLWGTLQGRPDSLYYQRFSAADHQAVYAANSVSKFWIDPDDDNQSLQWAAGTWNTYGVRADNVPAKIVLPGSRMRVILEGAGANDWNNLNQISPFGARADADGDGVADSRWVKLPSLSSSRGKSVFVAVRIIDNGAMLNLNTAFGFYQDVTDTQPWHSKPWFVSETHVNNNLPYETNADFGSGLGRVLSEVNYTPFLRAYDLDRVERLRLARDPITAAKPAQTAITPKDYHDKVIMKFESPGSEYTLFGIDDELEIRNRYLISGKPISRFEKRHLDTEGRSAIPPANTYSGALYYTLDFGRGIFGYDATAAFQNSRVKGVPFDNNDFGEWFEKVNPSYFDEEFHVNNGFKYDRRHISTFYSFDRPLRSGPYYLATTDVNGIAISLETLPDIEKDLFRPAGFRPLDLRTMTTPFLPDGVTPNSSRITANTLNARRNILYLLYAFRAAFLPTNFPALPPAQQRTELQKAARKSAQWVANLIDYLDDAAAGNTGPFGSAAYGSQANAAPTYINRAVVRQLISSVSNILMGSPVDIGAAASNPLDPREFGLGLDDAAETVFGFERQPFISEIYCNRNAASGGTVDAFALELVNPYLAAISLNGWRISIGTTNYDLDAAYSVPAATGVLPNQFGRLTIWAGTPVPVSGGSNVPRAGFGLSPVFHGTAIIKLQRPGDAANPYIVVDQTRPAQSTSIFSADGVRVSKRDDKEWKFANNVAYAAVDTAPTLGQANNVNATSYGFQLPVANTTDPFFSHGELTKVAFVSNQVDGTDPNTITDLVAKASGNESAIRLDVRTTPELLDYVCFLTRTEKGSLPGRININTAPLHVLAAAIPPQLVMSAGDTRTALDFARLIVDNRPYERVSDLLNITAFQKFAIDAAVNVGDQAILGDFEERDWIVSRLSNIFTVRSDVFTAWILVRLGEDGPERRMIAIFDRSQCWTPSDRPKLVALHPVSDPR